MADVNIRVRQTVSGSQDVASFGTKLTSTLQNIQVAAAAAAAAGVTFKKAFDFGREGQALSQITTSFDRMNEAIFMTPDLLKQMEEASRGTIREADLMAGVLKLTAGMGDDMARSFAEATPRLLEIAKAASVLNPSLGDTAFLYDSIATGIKRSSPLILDNLGIVVKIGEANEKYAASLGITVEQMTAADRQQALLNATLEAGDQLISQTGGSLDSATDAYDRLAIEIQETTDAAKRWLGEGLLPIVQSINGDYGGAVDNIVEKQREVVTSTEDAVEAAKRISEVSGIWGGFGVLITGTRDEVNNAAIGIASDMATMADSAEEFSKLIDEGFTGQGLAVFRTYARHLGITRDEFYHLARGANEAGMEIERFVRLANQLDLPDEEMEGFGRALKEAEGADQVLLRFNSAAQETKTVIGEASQALLEYEARREGIWTSETIQLHAELETERAEQELAEFKKTLGGPHQIQISMGGIDPGLQGVIDYLNQDLIETDQRARLNVDAELDEKQIRQAYVNARGAMNSGDYVLPIESDVDQEPIQTFLETARDVNEEIAKIPGVIESNVEGNFGDTKEALQAIKALIDGITGNHAVTFTTTTVAGGGGGTSGGGRSNRRAMGGNVYTNMPYLVGERGPELFVPGMAGSIVPNAFLANMSGGARGGDTSISIAVNGVSDPSRAADEVVRKLQDRGVLSRTMVR